MIFAIKSFEIHDGDGIRTTVFFKGCPLRCKWCHNPESFLPTKEILFDPEVCKNCMRCVSLCKANTVQNGQHVFARENCTLCGSCASVCLQKAFKIAGAEMTPQEIAAEALKDEIFMKGSGGGVTFSGGEPLMQVDLCVEIAKKLKERDINLAVDTCGAVPFAAFEKILPYTDMFLFDVKAIDASVHIACTGVSNERILDNLIKLDKTGIPIEIRYPYVPGMNDTEAERIAVFLKQLKNTVRVRILPYHSYAERKYESLGRTYPLPDIAVPKKAEIERVASKMRDCGLENVVLY